MVSLIGAFVRAAGGEHECEEQVGGSAVCLYSLWCGPHCRVKRIRCRSVIASWGGWGLFS